MPETLRDVQSLRDETLFPFLTVNEAKAKMGLSRASIYRLMASGDLGYTKPEGKRRMIPIAAIEQYAASLIGDAKISSAA